MRGRHIAADLADADENLAVADADSVINADVWIKADLDRRYDPGRIHFFERFLVKRTQYVDVPGGLTVNHGLTNIS